MNMLMYLCVVTCLVLAVTPVAHSESDPRAVEIAESVIDRMGGQDAWDATRYLQWRFLGKRQHYWDRATGDVRIEADDRIVLMNLWSKTGRAWDDGVEVPAGPALDEALEQGYAWWVNDSYWLIMPFKLIDPGVTLHDGGAADLPDGRTADLLVVTFADVGLTPQNKYHVWVARDTGLVEQWAYFPTASDAEPRFTSPWTGWKRFGGVLIATDRGRGQDWAIAAPDDLPRSLFESP